MDFVGVAVALGIAAVPVALVVKELEVVVNNDKINKLKSYLPYIPNKERQKAEDNFINLIKAIVNTKNKDKNIDQNIPVMKDIDQEDIDSMNILESIH